MRKILFIDDDVLLLEGLKRGLRKAPIELFMATSAKEGLYLLEHSGPFAVVVSDQHMPDMAGIAFLHQVKQRAPLSIRMMLTGVTDQNITIQAVNEGEIFRFISKPCPIDTLIAALKAGIRQYELHTAERELLHKTLAASVKLLIDILSTTAPDIFQTTTRAREWGRWLAPHLPDINPWELDMAILLSRIGYVLLPAETLSRMRNDETLSAMENDLIRQAPKSSADLLSNIPRMEGVARAILYQEKGFDGSGFPLISEHNSSSIELTADQIPLTSRVLKILLDISQMSTQKSPHPSVFDQLRERASLYDPKLLKLVEEVLLQTPPSQDQEQTLDVSLFGLRVGDEIVRPIKLKSGQLALGAAQRLSAVMLEKLKHFHRLHGVCEPIAIRRELERA